MDSLVTKEQCNAKAGEKSIGSNRRAVDGCGIQRATGRGGMRPLPAESQQIRKSLFRQNRQLGLQAVSTVRRGQPLWSLRCGKPACAKAF